MDIERYNAIILQKLSDYLTYGERSIDKAQVNKVCECGVSRHKAVELLLAGYLAADETLEREYLPHMLKKLNRLECQNDDYYKNIVFSNASNGSWQIKYDKYAPYEIFVQDDFQYIKGKVLPQLGYFEEEFSYPAVYQDGVLWMSVTPNEINTMAIPIQNAVGNVLTFGLGLGYFPYMCLQKGDVNLVTIVERDSEVIDLFKREILPQFPRKDDVVIINADAYDFLSRMRDGEFDYVFVDIYHDASDGIETYLKFKNYESRLKNTKVDFWIEKTIKYYL